MHVYASLRLFITVDHFRKEKDPQDKNNRNTKPNENDSFDIEVKDKESNKFNDSTGPRKNNNYEKGKNREKKFENDKFQSKTSPTSTKKLNDDDWGVKDEWGDTTAERYQNEDNRNIKENGHGPYNDVKPRGGRFNKGTRGGRNTYGGGDRRKEFDQSTERFVFQVINYLKETAKFFQLFLNLITRVLA